jgi:hypothetical protein
MDCSFLGGSTIPTLIECTIFNMGIPFDIFVLLIFGAFLLLALYARIDFTMSLSFAWIISYALMLLSGNASYLIQFIMNLLGLGIAIKIVVSLIGIFQK